MNKKIVEIVSQIKNNMSQIISYENNIKRKELQLYDRISKKKISFSERKNRNINSISISERRPFHISPINSNGKKKIIKIFDYQKYLRQHENGTLKNKKRLFTSIDANMKPKTLNEIEKLKKDIQQTIKKNELDGKIKQILLGLKKNNYKKNKIRNIINNDEEEDALSKILKKNDEINYGKRYNFYVTEGANLPQPLNEENINNNFNYN